MNGLKISELTFSYGAINVIDNLSLSLPSGTRSALIGASGSGKTTLLKLIMGLLQPNKGKLETPGKASCLMQEDTLLPWRNVWQHLTLSFELQGSRVDSCYIHELLHAVGLQGVENQYPHQLSGGMKRRVSLAQAILKEHSLLLMDEPFSSLDIHNREQMFDLLLTIQRKKRSTLLIAIHDYRDAIAIADQILWLKAGVIEGQWDVSDAIRNNPAKTGELIHQIRHATSPKALFLKG